ncbi:MAG TPA: hypothetical protein VJQ55_13615 [Candidatus Binatia bacterium]|nr:hypothetical protein [Candidatus Binatia bacterium]
MTPLPAAHSKERSRPPKHLSGAADGLRRIAHEIANQLTIVNLSCFRIRGKAKALPPLSLEDLARVEQAVIDISNLVQALRELESEPAPAPKPRSSASRGATNVYPLFDSHNK